MYGIFADVSDVRNYFGDLLRSESFVTDKSGCKMLEMTGASFIANSDHIFGKPNEDYINRELKWYNSMSRSVHDIEGETPKIWLDVSDKNGVINSNYGWCILSGENFFQYQTVKRILEEKPDSRQAVMIYTRPNMHIDAFDNDRHDFMCTNAVQYMIRDGQLNAVVQMRSNDAWAGYRNDFAWQLAVQSRLAGDLEVEVGPIVWQVGSLHIYKRNFWMVDHYTRTGDAQPKKVDYDGEWLKDAKHV